MNDDHGRLAGPYRQASKPRRPVRHRPGARSARWLAGCACLPIPAQTIRANRKARCPMPPLLRSLPVTAVLVAAAVCLVHLGVDLAPRTGLDRKALDAVQRHLDEGALTDEELERRRQIYLRRLDVKDRAVKELLAGRLTLP